MGPREATSGLRGINKWKKGEQQVERVGATGENRMSNKWMELQQVEMEIAQQVGQASQMKESSQKAREPDKPGSQTARSQIARWIG